MKLEDIEKLIDNLGENMQHCGDLEYGCLHRVRCALHEYAETIKTLGTGQPRAGYKEKELKNDKI